MNWFSLLYKANLLASFSCVVKGVLPSAVILPLLPFLPLPFPLPLPPPGKGGSGLSESNKPIVIDLRKSVLIRTTGSCKKLYAKTQF